MPQTHSVSPYSQGDPFDAMHKATQDLFELYFSISEKDENGMVTLPDGTELDMNSTTGYILFSTYMQIQNSTYETTSNVFQTIKSNEKTLEQMISA
jgi:hypothetical protein